MKTFKRFNAKSSKKDKLPMTIVEKYRTWLVENENNVVSLAGARKKLEEKERLTAAVNKAHKTFHDVNNDDDDANPNAVKRLCDMHKNASPEGRAHMENLINGEGHEETRWQIDEHGDDDHALTKAVRAHQQK